MQHLPTVTPTEYVVLGKPLRDGPMMPKRRLGTPVDGTLADIAAPFVLLDIDSLPKLDAEVSHMSAAEIHRYAVADLPEEFRRADCVMFLSGSHATSQGKVKVFISGT